VVRAAKIRECPQKKNRPFAKHRGGFDYQKEGLVKIRSLRKNITWLLKFAMVSAV
jgi:hypothetical protein